MRILMILTIGCGESSSACLSLDQVIEAYYLLRDSGMEVVVASSHGEDPVIRGGRERSAQVASSTQRFRRDRSARDAVSDTLKLEQIYPEDFDGAICIGVLEETAHPGDAQIVLSLLQALLASGKPVAIVPRKLELVPQGAFDGLLITGGGVRAPALAAKAVLASLG